MKMTIADAVGKVVRVEREDGSTKQPDFRAVGRLEDYTNDDVPGPCFIVRTSDTGHGWNFVSFTMAAVVEVYQQPSGIIEVELR